MPLPGITYITVHGTYLDILDNPCSGSITFTPPPVLVDPGSSVVYSHPVSANLDSTGSFSVSLVCTDNAPLVPVGWAYTVTERISGAATRTYQVFLPHTLGSSVDFSTVTPIPTVTGVPAIIPSGVVAPGYGGLAYSQTWTGNNTFTGTTVFSGPVTLSGYIATGAAASGDLSGTYPGPTVAKINGVTVTGAPTTGQVITATSAISATWQTPTGGGGGGVQIGGDLGGTLSVPTVISTHLSAALPLAQGGTGAATAAGARTNLGLGTAAVENIGTDPTVILPVHVAVAGTVGAVADIGHGHPYQPWQFHVAAYGAYGDDTHDDTTAWINAVNAAYTYAQNHRGYAELLYDPLPYLIASAPITGGSTLGNAQIPLPVNAETAQKIILSFRSTRGQYALYHWHQTTSQKAGAILHSTWNAGTTTPTVGEASVLGGPTFHYLGDPPSSWNNLMVSIDGLGIVVPTNPCIAGIDLAYIAEASVNDINVLAISAGTGAPQIPDPNWAFGLRMPICGNNDVADIGRYSCEGLVYGLIGFEHIEAESIRLINCFDGLTIFSGSGFPHNNHFNYVSIENCTQCIALAGSFNKLIIDVCDLEWGSGAIIRDGGATPAIGRIGFTSNGATGDSLNAALSSGANAVTVINGTLGLEVVNLDQRLGAVTAPTLPASGTALTNPFWRTCEVTIAGGTVTQIAVDGANRLITSGTVTVPPGKTIAVTYSVAPSWSWCVVS